MTIINQDEIPDDLSPGKYCCHFDESTTWSEFRVRFVVPPRAHVPGDCLVQIVKADPDTEG
jgi:hypothetical protein